MNVYLLTGTHLPELRTCVRTLADQCPQGTAVHIHVPDGLDWSSGKAEAQDTRFYNSGDVDWVFNPDEEAANFILLDPREPQVPQLEKIASDLQKCLIEPVKVITCVDCQAAESSAQLRAWLEANIYYSDIVLLGNRAGASKPFLRDFQKSYARNCYPCLFLFLKGKGVPEKPLDILTPDTRRLSQLFDLPEDREEELPGLIIEASCDLDLEEPEKDPYRNPETEEGQAKATVPDIRKYIVPMPPPEGSATAN